MVSDGKNLKGEEATATDREAAMPMVRFCAMVALHQIETKRKIMISGSLKTDFYMVT